jgi:predicted  nucleic acid-binding Zn-ribbon protein
MSDNDVAILLEEIRDQNKVVLEAVGDMQQQVALTAKQSDLEEVKVDIKSIKVAIRDSSKQIHNHEKRITKLEATAKLT